MTRRPRKQTDEGLALPPGAYLEDGTIVIPQGAAANPESHVQPSWAATCPTCSQGLGAYATAGEAIAAGAAHQAAAHPPEEPGE